MFSTPLPQAGGLPGQARRGAAAWAREGSWGRWGGVCYEHLEKGAVGRTRILGRRMFSSPIPLAGALNRLLIFGKHIQQGGQICCVWILLGCSCEPRAEWTQTD